MSYLQKGHIEVARGPLDQQVLLGHQPIAINEIIAPGCSIWKRPSARAIALLVLPVRVCGTAIGC